MPSPRPLPLLVRFALLCLIPAILAPRTSLALEPGEMDPARFDQLLKKYVADGRVDYSAWKAGGTEALDAYLDSLAVYDLTRVLGKEPRAALLMNAYEAWSIRQILEHYPVKSVKDIPGFFDKNTRKIAGEDRTLDGIEAALAELIPHSPEFALALCNGTLGGPRIVEEAFRSDTLARRFDAAMKAAVADKRMYYDPKANEMHYPPQVVKYLPQYEALPNGIAGKFANALGLSNLMALTSKHPKVVEDPIDWGLNGLPPRTGVIKNP
jgi:hypothetical protein